MSGKLVNRLQNGVTAGLLLVVGLTAIEAQATNSLIVNSDGNVGVGTSSPANALHILRDTGSASLRVEETSTTVDRRELLTLTNNGNVKFVLADTNSGDTWDFSARTNGFNVNLLGTGGQEFLIKPDGTFRVGPGGIGNFIVHPDGNADLAGTLTQGSSRTIKHNIADLDVNDLLETLAELDISTWQYKGQNTTHIGPMAEDFYTAYRLGESDKSIAISDIAGVALASAKALYDENTRLKLQLGELRSEVEEKSNALLQLQKQVSELADVVYEVKHHRGYE